MTELRRMDSYAFKTALERGESPDEAVIEKHYGYVEKQIEGQERLFRFVVSDAGRDRDNDTIDPAGWELGFFTQNPVILFGHDHRTPPVARAERVFEQEGKLKADIRFLDLETDSEHKRFIDTLAEMAKPEVGGINATSVGFIPRRFDQRGDGDEPGVDFKEQELIEISLVPVPSNPRAIREDRGFVANQRGFLDCQEKGIDPTPVREWAQRVIDQPVAKGLDIRPVEQAWKKALAEPAKRVEGAEKSPEVDPDATAPRGADPEGEKRLTKRTGEVFRDRVGFQWDAEAEQAQQRDFDNFFVDREGKAVDEGSAPPRGMESQPEDAESVFVVVREDRSGEKATNRILRRRFEGFDTAVATARERTADEADPNLVFIVGEKVGEIPEETRSAEEPTPSPETTEKRGRVLSRANENRIRRAVESLSEVLQALGEQPEEDAAEGGEAKADVEIDGETLELAEDEKEIDLDEVAYVEPAEKADGEDTIEVEDEEIPAIAETLAARLRAGLRSA